MKVIIVVFLFYFRESQDCVEAYDNFPCHVDPRSTVSPSDPRLPLLPTSFEVHIEGVFIDQQRSISVDEYVDTDEGVAAWEMLSQGVKTKHIYNHNTDELYVIRNEQCETIPSPNNSALFLGGNQFSTSSILKFATRYGEVYKGRANISGIVCDHWQACMTWDSMNATFSVDFYFSAPEWGNAATDTTKVPVRAEVIGVKTTNQNKTFHHIYNYVGFKDYLKDETVLQTPAGVACTNRKVTTKMPSLDSAFQYRLEVKNINKDTVTQYDIYYDSMYKIVRVDYQVNATTTINIHDFNTGMSYTIDKTLGNCTSGLLTDTSFGARGSNVSPFHVVLEKPDDMFLIDSSFAYSGQRTARGIDCDVFTGFKYDVHYKSNVTVEIYYMSDEWKAKNDIGLDSSSTSTPVRRTENSELGDIKLVYDLYDFDPEHPNANTAFDVTACFNQLLTVDFTLTLSGNVTGFQSEKNMATLQDQIGFSLASWASISPIRIQRSRLLIINSNVFFFATLLDKSPLRGSIAPTTDKATSIGGVLEAWKSQIGRGGKVIQVLNTTFTAVNMTEIGTTSQPPVTNKSSGSKTKWPISASSTYTSASGSRTKTPIAASRYTSATGHEQSTSTESHVCNKNPSPQTQNAGKTAGISMATLVLGIIVGVAAVIVFQKLQHRRRGSFHPGQFENPTYG